MNIQRSSIVSVSMREIVEALKVAHPLNVDIQAIPSNMMGVDVVSDKAVVTIVTTRSTRSDVAGRG